MPKYDFRCDRCSATFEVTRSFDASADPARCPRDGASARRLFSPPLDLLMYRREPVDTSGPVTIPPGALSCHDHGPPPSPERDAAPAGSRWHASGYDAGPDNEHEHEHEEVHSHAHGPGQAHAHGSGHGHNHGHRHPH